MYQITLFYQITTLSFFISLTLMSTEKLYLLNYDLCKGDVISIKEFRFNCNGGSNYTLIL